MDAIVGILLITVAVGTAVLCVALAGFTRRLVEKNVALAKPRDERLGADIEEWMTEPPPLPRADTTDSAANG